MLFWLGLVAGAIIGWVIEWVIDWRFWRRDVTVVSDEEGRLRRELEVARLEISRLQTQASTYTTDVPTGDRLQDINGIGQVYAKRLHEAGIRTFADLAASTPQKLADILKPQEWQTLEFDAWIRQAHSFAKKINTQNAN